MNCIMASNIPTAFWRPAPWCQSDLVREASHAQPSPASPPALPQPTARLAPCPAPTSHLLARRFAGPFAAQLIQSPTRYYSTCYWATDSAQPPATTCPPVISLGASLWSSFISSFSALWSTGWAGPCSSQVSGAPPTWVAQVGGTGSAGGGNDTGTVLRRLGFRVYTSL